MSKAARTLPGRTADARLRKRYAAERRFRLAGLFAVALSAAFLAFLLVTMAWKGLSGFTRFEAAVPIDFARSDVMLDPAALQGPQASEAVAGAGWRRPSPTRRRRPLARARRKCSAPPRFDRSAAS